MVSFGYLAKVLDFYTTRPNTIYSRAFCASLVFMYQLTLHPFPDLLTINQPQFSHISIHQPNSNIWAKGPKPKKNNNKNNSDSWSWLFLAYWTTLHLVGDLRHIKRFPDQYTYGNHIPKYSVVSYYSCHCNKHMIISPLATFLVGA